MAEEETRSHSERFEQTKSMVQHLSPQERLALLKTLVTEFPDADRQEFLQYLTQELKAHKAQNQPSRPEEIDTNLEAIDHNIIARHVQGQFKGRVTFHGQQFFDENYNADKGLGSVTIPKIKSGGAWDTTGQVSALDEIIRRG